MQIFPQFGSPLLVGDYTLWLPALAGRGGSMLPSWGKYGPGKFVGSPQWVTRGGFVGIRPASGSYVNLSPGASQPQFKPTSTGTLAVCYSYRFDGLANELGTIFSAGAGGVCFRHRVNAGHSAVEFVKSNISVLASFNADEVVADQVCTAAVSVWNFGAASKASMFFNGRLRTTGNSSADSSFTGATATCLGQDFATGATIAFGQHTVFAILWIPNVGWGQAQAEEWHRVGTLGFLPWLPRTLPLNYDFHSSADLSGSTTQGFSLGSSPDNEPWFTEGIGLGASAGQEPFFQQGFSLGAVMNAVDAFGQAFAGMSFGSDPDEDREASEGLSLGASFTLDGQYASSVQGLALGSRAVSDSGDLANNRYRR